MNTFVLVVFDKKRKMLDNLAYIFMFNVMVAADEQQILV